jgi:predicted flavoprotein YhiN
MTENTDVVVIGGGYAGVMVANCLTQRDDVTVTLISPRPTFVERIRLHQLVGGCCLTHAFIGGRLSNGSSSTDVSQPCAGGVPLLLSMHA